MTEANNVNPNLREQTAEIRTNIHHLTLQFLAGSLPFTETAKDFEKNESQVEAESAQRAAKEIVDFAKDLWEVREELKTLVDLDESQIAPPKFR